MKKSICIAALVLLLISVLSLSSCYVDEDYCDNDRKNAYDDGYHDANKDWEERIEYIIQEAFIEGYHQGYYDCEDGKDAVY